MTTVQIFTSMSGLELKENLGRGERIANTIYVTNDELTKKQIVTPDIKLSIGLFEYKMLLLKDALLVYAKLDPVAKGSEHDVFDGFLVELFAFMRWTWLSYDHAIRIGSCYLWSDGDLALNAPTANASKSDGTLTSLRLTRDEFRNLRSKQNDDWSPLEHATLRPVLAKENSTRVSRALHYVSNAYLSPFCIDKIIHYCSALEALFATSHSELVHLLAERTAIVMSKDYEARHTTYQTVRECYRLRSAYTHGSVLKQKELDVTKRMSVALDQIVRKCVNTIMDDNSLNVALQSNENLDAWFLKELFS